MLEAIWIPTWSIFKRLEQTRNLVHSRKILLHPVVYINARSHGTSKMLSNFLTHQQWQGMPLFKHEGNTKGKWLKAQVGYTKSVYLLTTDEFFSRRKRRYRQVSRSPNLTNLPEVSLAISQLETSIQARCLDGFLWSRFTADEPNNVSGNHKKGTNRA